MAKSTKQTEVQEEDIRKIWVSGLVVVPEKNMILFPKGYTAHLDDVMMFLYLSLLKGEVQNTGAFLNLGKQRFLDLFSSLPKAFVDGKRDAAESQEPEFLKQLMRGGE